MNLILNMGKIGKTFALALIVIIAISNLSLLMVRSSNAQIAAPSGIPTPPIPEFTLEYANQSLNYPAVHGPSAYYRPAGHFEWQTINITITNEPFTTFNITVGNVTYYYVHVGYDIRAKMHDSESWNTLSIPNSSPDTHFWQTELQPFTTITFYMNVNIYSSENASLFSFFEYYGNYPLAFVSPAGGQVDFQVQEIIGGFSNVYTPQGFTFYGNEGAWSKTETITIPASSVSPSLTPTVSELSWLVIVPLLLSVFSLAVIFRHRKTANSAK